MSTDERPVCGGGGIDAANYDFPLHIAAVFIVFAASIAGAGFPVVAKKIRWMKIPPKVFFFCKHFGTGVLIATAFVHLVPTAFASLTDPCLPPLFTDIYPALPGVIMMFSLFCLFALEMWLNGKTGGHSHGGPTGTSGSLVENAARFGISTPLEAGRSRGPLPGTALTRNDSYMSDGSYPDEKAGYVHTTVHPVENPFETKDGELPSEMPAWFVAFYKQYVRQRDELIAMVTRVPSYTPDPQPQAYPAVSSFDRDEEGWVDPLVLKKMNLNITLLEGGILFHSIFVGMTISITSEGFIILLIAILFHQFFEGLGLGSRIAEVPYPKKSPRPWILVVAFGTTCPIGQVIGLVTRNSYDPSSAFALILVGVFNAISSGLLIYAALVDLLQEDFLSEEANRTLSGKDKIVAFLILLLGALGMAIVGAFA
ncbi:Zinc/iron permease [Patellaria atrata CBS 101060]|uniref:Zinc/iron permease n=1 Tax=Patellaria atrata CBS 101060 TaxID=1346257 RepID=A0A9P4VSW9_9PEZI|nr:Zinc/iron permease [Patellaria atrata CBS 101060]